MKIVLRVLCLVLGNLLTLPFQIVLLIAILASNLSKEEWDDFGAWCHEMDEGSKLWIKTGRFDIE